MKKHVAALLLALPFISTPVAALQCLKNKGLDKAIEDKMTESDGVPQVGTYVLLGEMKP